MLRVLSALVAALPWRWLRLPGAALGLLAGSALRIRRAGVEAAMRRAGVGSPAPAARAMYRSLGAGVFELLWLAGASARRRERVLAREITLDPEARRALDEALARGPVVLAASHTGNWELAAFAAARELSAYGRRLAVVTKPIRLRAVDAFCTELRARAGIALLSPRGALAAARAHLAAGDVVAMPIDQVPDLGRHGEQVRFLGADALADRAPATLALRGGATLLVVAASRRGARHRVHVLASLAPEAWARASWPARATSAATAELDAFVRREPASWLWLHRRWRDPARQAHSLVASPHPG